jgi:hypothetical protein
MKLEVYGGSFSYRFVNLYGGSFSYRFVTYMVDRLAILGTMHLLVIVVNPYGGSRQMDIL